ncbi:response regulator transcription factor [Rhodoplanes sp. TEM]|uniref:Response regulator transcription factor n=1 Tax=Rhodoplanes tepidamans TaxID=200616 RepID=A0ABT5JEE1_RHOTP|nr:MULTISPECIES: response regulator transcription factor [Rhodoplanes]MDC7788038.1 response regulator transcription factor [Rhodoplanes tepidamans]MDC7987310.1 response regulator transcription factor [Rhodoplanes sp. TEM]MDQ0353973.1 DNA-binding CsgD family transcriptional regulator [Rhodoplanes tepidamans]
MTTSDALFRDLRVYTALLDRFGFILSVNSQWKAFVDAGGLVLPFEDRPPNNYGVGENYLRFCAFADPLSPRLITGISQLLAGQTEAVSIVYQRRSPVQNTSFMLLGFPCATDGSRAALLHVDITAIATALAEARKAGGAPAAGAAELSGAAASLESAIGAAVAGPRVPLRAALLRPSAADSGDERQPPLSKRQWQVLSLMTNGLTNVEIARQLGLSPNTVKIHVSGILARLGLPSRTQAVHWALTQGRQDQMRQDKQAAAPDGG